MSTLGVFHTMVSEACNKGTSLDSMIDDYTRMAARWIERNFNHKYMERCVSFTIDYTVAQPRGIPLAGLGFKAMKSLQIADPTSTATGLLLRTIPKVHRLDITEIDEGFAEGYWMDGYDYLWLDKTPLENYTAYMTYWQYTTWPTLTTSEPWLLANAEDLMLAQTMLMLAPAARESEWATAWRPIRDEALRTLSLAEDAAEWENTDSRMIYAGAYTRSA